MGRSGLEKSLEDVLGGKTGSTVWVVDHAGFQYEKKADEQVDPIRGKSVTTTIDIDLQRVTENALEGYTGAAVAIDVDSGDVLVLANKPDYNLNNLSPYISSEVFKDIESRGAWLKSSYSRAISTRIYIQIDHRNCWHEKQQAGPCSRATVRSQLHHWKPRIQ